MKASVYDRILGMPTRKSSAAAWWLDQGEEVCAHCGVPYLYELEFRCAECDGPGCMHCRELHVKGHYVCPQCVPSRGKPSGSTSRRKHAHGG